MKQKINSIYLFSVAFFLVAGFASMVAIAKSDNASNNTKGDSAKSEKTEKAEKVEKTTQAEEQNKNKVKEGVEEKIADLKEYKKADTAKGETNAQVHKEKTTKVIKKLEEIAKKEDVSNKVDDNATGESAVDEVRMESKKKVNDKIKEVAVEQSASQEPISEAIEEVENDGVVKKFLFGPDYKNLGQLRSELVQNRNQIRKLTQAINVLAQDGGATMVLENQLIVLNQERERIKSIVTANQNTFSLLGWFTRFMNNYEEIPIDEQEEADLTAEVEVAIGRPFTNIEDIEATPPADVSIEIGIATATDPAVNAIPNTEDPVATPDTSVSQNEATL